MTANLTRPIAWWSALTLCAGFWALVIWSLIR